MNFVHKSVMLNEVLNALVVKPNGIYLDCTLGGAGHSLAIGKLLDKNGLIIGLDQDEDAISTATKNLSGLACGIKIVRDNFSNLDKVLDNLRIEKIDGALFDLGISSYQIDTAERGFSYMKNSPLDMRMDRRKTLTAHDVINTYDEDRLIKIFREYGEERFSKRIAVAICRARKISPIESTAELVKLVEQTVPRTKNGGHPAKRIFQAIRIEVNGELEILGNSIKNTVDRLKIGGRLAVITFHSLEDRIVKETFRTLAQGCICPKNFPVCVCNHKAQIKILGKAKTPTPQEIELNSRAKSAKLRVAEKIGEREIDRNFQRNSKEEYYADKT
ncbi:MAG: 16S rRNA (cytosine(1402)-N(4))-methyltransferase RsmH [Selenomonadaceae bacterium]|nr:16S rRNA (cytosine(1402)-N(4))-methyltransferase RsmH [Selenomonadaceae bacterium]